MELLSQKQVVVGTGTQTGPGSLGIAVSSAGPLLLQRSRAQSNGAAYDNPSESNGLFTKVLLAALNTPNLDLKGIFEKTKNDVYAASKGQPRPFTYDGVIGQFYFKQVPAPAAPAAPSGADLIAEEEIAYWNGMFKTDPESLRLYLNRYGDKARFSDIARRNLKKLVPDRKRPVERRRASGGTGGV